MVVLRTTNELVKRMLAIAGILSPLFFAYTSHAVGTSAGQEINNSAQANYAIGGVVQSEVDSNIVLVYVDELLDVVVVNDDGAPVSVTTPGAFAELQFSITNTGNGSESFRLIAEHTVNGDDFDPGLTKIYLESNGSPGLQTGGGGDTVYIAGNNDPVLAADSTLVVYAVNTIPAGLNQDDQGFVELRAISGIIFAQSGTDDPNNVGFPSVGTQYAGQGDLDENGAANVNAVVGTSHNLALLLLRDSGIYYVSAALVSLVKSVLSVLDPFGGTTVVPGSVVQYQIVASVTGTGSVESLLITDELPAELEYVASSLVVVPALSAGEQADDDFLPAGTDNTGFSAGSSTVTISLGDVVAGAADITITFEATIR